VYGDASLLSEPQSAFGGKCNNESGVNREAQMACTIDLNKIDLYPGQTLSLHSIDWSEFERILDGLGDRRSRLVYCDSKLELRMPLPEHEKIKRFLAMVVEICLDRLELDWEAYGSTTLKRCDRGVGIEPDECFYIRNATDMAGLRRIDLTVDPPPDLAIEVDVTSVTRLEAYAAIGVPELWRYRENAVEIWRLDESGRYVRAQGSQVVAGLPVLEAIALFLPRLHERTLSQVKRELRQWLETRVE
jgi:Uma2 family endonuclease